MMKGISLGRPEIPAKSPTEGIQIAPASYRAVLQPIDFSALLWRDRAFPKPLETVEKLDHAAEFFVFVTP